MIRYILLITLFYLSSFYSIGQWTQIGQDIDGSNSGDLFGYSVDINDNGSIIVVGSPQSDVYGLSNIGQVKVYENINGNWVLKGNVINGDSTVNSFGQVVQISADGTVIAACGLLSKNGFFSQTKVYVFNNNQWIQVGQTIEGDSIDSSSNIISLSLSLSSNGKIIAIGSNRGYGKVVTYKNISGTWYKIGQAIPGNETIQAFGISISLNANGTILAIGAYNIARIYEYQNGYWIQIGNNIGPGIKISLNANGDILSSSGNAGISIYQYDNFIWNKIHYFASSLGNVCKLNNNGDKIAIGNPDGYGASHVYENNNGSWTRINNIIFGEALDDESGFSIGINSSGSIVVIGAPYNDGDTTYMDDNRGHVRIYGNSVGINDDEIVNVNIFPNPTSDILNIEGNNLKTIEIKNILGQSLTCIHTTNYHTIIDVNSYEMGLYFLIITTTNNEESIYKVVLQ
jgi:hypothetical protein